MKIFKMFLMSFFITALSFNAINAENRVSNYDGNKEAVSAAVIGFLSDSDHLLKAEPRSATINLLVTDEGEIVVLDVDTDCSDIELFVKSNLNYKKINLGDVEAMSTYALTITYGDTIRIFEDRSVDLVNPIYDLSLSTFKVVPTARLEETKRVVQQFNPLYDLSLANFEVTQSIKTELGNRIKPELNPLYDLSLSNFSVEYINRSEIINLSIK